MYNQHQWCTLIVHFYTWPKCRFTNSSSKLWHIEIMNAENTFANRQWNQTSSRRATKSSVESYEIKAMQWSILALMREKTTSKITLRGKIVLLTAALSLDYGINSAEKTLAKVMAREMAKLFYHKHHLLQTFQVLLQLILQSYFALIQLFLQKYNKKHLYKWS